MKISRQYRVTQRMNVGFLINIFSLLSLIDAHIHHEASLRAAWRVQESAMTRAQQSSPADLVFIDNGVVRLGIDMNRGGSIGYMADANHPETNLINTHDMGREVQLSYYSGPSFYNPPTPKYPNGACDKLFRGQEWPWNPIGAGDVDGNHGEILNITHDAASAHLLTRPLQWACHNVACDCTFEMTFSLDTPAGTGVRVDAILHTAREDTTVYPPRDQELPAVYTNAPYYRLITYNGSQPFTPGTSLSELEAGFDPSAAFPWVPGHFSATEHWAAMVNADGWGVGVVNPQQIDFIGGFSGKKGPGGPTDSSTGYIAPVGQIAIPPRGALSYTFYLVLGDLDTIRAFAWQVQGRASPLSKGDVSKNGSSSRRRRARWAAQGDGNV